MRLHHLEITAFGPFAETVRVDFDALSDAGLFLLTGPTGAGKTSVLDAVCFALYGEVPGDRQAARRLRCDQAAAGVAPRVVLDVTLTGRRFRLDRSPAWERPKKRGTGTTAQQASVRLLERVDGEWVPLSQRLDETGQMVSRLVGLTMTQFCQVALLPQGRFQAFLRARSEDRQRLLQQLFRTARFEAVERWLRDRRRELRQASAAHHDEVADLVSRTSEAASVALPEGWDVTDLAAPADKGELAAWSAQQLGTAEEAVATGAIRVERAVEQEAAARSALDAGREVARLQAARQQALAEQARLREREPSHSDDRRRLADARRAAGVLPVHAQATDLADAAVRAAERRGSLVASVAAHGQADPADLDTAALEAMEAGLRDRAAAARALAPREATLADLERRIPATERDIEARETELADVDAQLTALPARRQRLHEELAEARQAGDLLPTAVRHVATLRDRGRAAEEAAALEAELGTARAGLTSTVETLLDVKETWLQVQQQRLEGMAAELAGGLAVGADCPVCGSHDHPRPATAQPGAPDAAAEKAARRRVDDAEAMRLLHEERVRDLQARIAGARERAAGEGDPAAELPVAGAEVTRLEELHARAEGLAEELGQVEGALERLGTCRDGLLAGLAAARAQAESLRRESVAISAELEAALADSDAVTLTDLAADLDILATGCRAALLAEAEATRAAAAASEASERLAAALAAAGFESVESLLEAALDERAVAALETRIRDHEQAVARVVGVLEAPDVRTV
ncbi:AAA family ATPase, partial [Nocardioides sp. GCM10027113]